MWALLSSWFRRLLFFSVVLPVIGRALGKLANIMEDRRGEKSKATRLLRTGAKGSQKLRKRGRRKRRR
ncbi:MAG: hypothetical protein ACR2MA_02060 [Egibacteraceae bacterium]